MNYEVFWGAGVLPAREIKWVQTERSLHEAASYLLTRMRGRIQRRVEAEFLGLPTFVVIRDCMGRPCRLEAL